MRWPKYWSFRFIIIPSKEIPGLISFRMDWLDLLEPEIVVQDLETLGPGRKALTNLDSILKSRDITLPKMSI